jgi:formate hydrogenlyase subunit 3/multisubunit Na+/H+ antiporter MnhD subunit
MYFALGIGTLTLVAASLMIEPFLYAAIFLEMGAITAAILLSSRKLKRNRGGLRLLVLYTLAMLAILLVGWLLEVNQQEIEVQGLSIRSALLLGFGFTILLSIPPFHSWLPISAGENHPNAWAFISIILPSTGFFFLIHFLNNYIWLNEKTDIYGILTAVGSFMTVAGALWSFVQKDLRKMASYAVVADLGVMLVAFGTGSQEGLELALMLTFARVISLVGLAQGLNNIVFADHESIQNQDKIEEKPSGLKIAAIITGMVSLAGFPLTAGFPGRWGILKILAGMGHYAWIAILCSMLILGFTTIRGAKILHMIQHKASTQVLGLTERIFLWGGIVLSLIFGIFPQLVYPWINSIIDGLT